MSLFQRLGRLLFCLTLGLAAAAWAAVPVPVLKARVTDLTQTLPAAQRTALESDLQDLEARTGAQLAVLLLPSTQPEAIEQFSMRVAETWKLGRKGKDDGVLLVVAKDDRRVRIEVGYGLEGSIPDALARRVIDETITPLFKQGDIAGGIQAGVRRLAGLIENRPESPAESCPADPEPRPLPKPSAGSNVIDLTATLSAEQAWTLSRELADFYDSGRTKPAFVLIVPSVKPEGIGDFAARVLRTWGEEDNLDVDRSILLVVAKDDGAAHIASGAGLGGRILPGATAALVADIIEPKLRSGQFVGAIQAGVHGLEKTIDDAIGNKTFSERLSAEASQLPIWLLLSLAAVGTGLRWLLGPLFGALLTGGAVGAGTWFVSGEVIEIAVAAGVIAFIFVLIGLANWIAMFLDGAVGGGSGGGGSSGGSGSFGGGGGGFGGGGASGSW